MEKILRKLAKDTFHPTQFVVNNSYLSSLFNRLAWS